MDNVQALLGKRAEIVHIFRYVYLRSASVGTLAHPVVKDLKGHALPQIVGIFLIVDEVMEADVFDIPLLEMLFGEIRSRAAAQNIITHNSFSFLILQLSDTIQYPRPSLFHGPPLFKRLKAFLRSTILRKPGRENYTLSTGLHMQLYHLWSALICF